MTANKETFVMSCIGQRKAKLRKGSVCDMHEDREAVYAAVTEEDSMGVEITHYCKECLEEEKKEMSEVWDNPSLGGESSCDRCKKTFPNFKELVENGQRKVEKEFCFHKDIEDGTVDMLCGSCKEIREQCERDFWGD